MCEQGVFLPFFILETCAYVQLSGSVKLPSLHIMFFSVTVLHSCKVHLKPFCSSVHIYEFLLENDMNMSVNICVPNCSQEILKSFFMYLSECELFICLEMMKVYFFEFIFPFIK